ncbi:hypothetical protein CBS147332_261 [Penicillium roqueforti]|nr:hypothetical protein CBS147332_261 [Penicillium roqueforti]KAI3120913.1 hypothetical protein CBS147331_2132 [Penicillium roqueforti]
MTPGGVEVEAGLHDLNYNTTKTISDSSFFREHRASTLPTPVEVRTINEESGNICGTSFNRSPPVKFPSLGLIVKYGADTTVTEADPKYGRETLEQIWGALNDEEREANSPTKSFMWVA